MRKLLAVFLAAAVIGCGLKIASVDQVAIDLTNAVCTPLENQPAGQPWVDFACTLAQGIEQSIAQLETATDAGLIPLPAVKTVTVRVPQAEAVQFMATHRAPVKK